MTQNDNRQSVTSDRCCLIWVNPGDVWLQTADHAGRIVSSYVGDMALHNVADFGRARGIRVEVVVRPEGCEPYGPDRLRRFYGRKLPAMV